ncbi:MAG: 3-hydroxyacyl-CoA dehydrogenase family protein [Bacteroidota bacterium]
MHIVVKAGAQQKQEFLSKGVPGEIWVSFLETDGIIPGADAYFDLCFEPEDPAFSSITDKPVFANAVIATSTELPANYIRINAWDGFLKREIMEIVAAGPQVSNLNVLDALGWKYQLVPDVPGMIAARVIAMIINEAYFGLGDEISTKKEIDIAMKLGTNYPYGPFEWSEKIGLEKIYALLKKLSEKDNRYAVAPSLEKEVLLNK